MNIRRITSTDSRQSAISPPTGTDLLFNDSQEYRQSRAARRGRRPKHIVSIGRTTVGKGIFARKNIRQDEIVGEIEGVLIADASYGSDYCFKLGEQYRLEPEPPFRYVNHSCDPNCEFDWLEVAKHGGLSVTRRAFLIALKDIRRGEQLTIDYNWSASATMLCRCNSPNCRGWIVDEDQLEEVIKTTSSVGP
jgi:hypothetical protein